MMIRLSPHHYQRVAWLLLLLAVGCKARRETENRTDTLPAPPSASTTARPKDTVGSYLHPTWTPADLEKILRDGGITLVTAGQVKQPFLGPAGVRYQIGASELQAYIYGDAVALARDTDPLDTTRVAPPTMMISWRLPPTLIIDNNLAIILLTKDDKLRARVRAAVKGSHSG